LECYGGRLSSIWERQRLGLQHRVISSEGLQWCLFGRCDRKKMVDGIIKSDKKEKEDICVGEAMIATGHKK